MNHSFFINIDCYKTFKFHQFDGSFVHTPLLIIKCAGAFDTNMTWMTFNFFNHCLLLFLLKICVDSCLDRWMNFISLLTSSPRSSVGFYSKMFVLVILLAREIKERGLGLAILAPSFPASSPRFSRAKKIPKTNIFD